MCLIDPLTQPAAPSASLTVPELQSPKYLLSIWKVVIAYTLCPLQFSGVAFRNQKDRMKGASVLEVGKCSGASCSVDHSGLSFLSRGTLLAYLLILFVVSSKLFQVSKSDGRFNICCFGIEREGWAWVKL